MNVFEKIIMYKIIQKIKIIIITIESKVLNPSFWHKLQFVPFQVAEKKDDYKQLSFVRKEVSIAS